MYMHHTVVNTYIYIYIYSVVIVLIDPFHSLHSLPLLQVHHQHCYHWALLPLFGVYECPSGQTGFIGKLKQVQSVG